MKNLLFILSLLFAFPAFAGDRVIINPDSGGDLKLKVNIGGTATDALTVAGSGNVGVGTTAPADKLEVKATGTTNVARITSDQSTARIIFSTSGADRGQIASSTSDAIRFNNAAGTELANFNGTTKKFQTSGPVNIIDSGSNTGNVPHECQIRTGTVVTNQTSTSSCSAGEIVVGGGCVSGTATDQLSRSFPNSATQWACVYTASVAGNTAYAICCDY
jgi:hypothetical protein